MKMNKKVTAICAFVIGATIFTTAAFADVIVGSGYNGLKNAVKTTTAKLSNEVESFTLDANVTVKVDGETCFEAGDTARYDVANQRLEERNYSSSKEENTEDFYYRDNTKYITMDEGGSYYVNKFEIEQTSDDEPFISDPFEDEMAEDMEKVLDAFVGNLKDIVQVEEQDGKKMYMGNLSESQMPTLVNAVSSFVLKYSFFDDRQAEEMGFPALVSDIYLKEVNGKAIENQDGILESAIGSVLVSGADKNGTEHIIGFDVSISISEINQTTVEEPNLEGKEVNYSTVSYGPRFDQKYIGTYKNDIVKEQDEQFVKIGERVLEITSVEGDKITGKYYETYTQDAPESVPSFDLVGTIEKNGNVKVSYTEGDKANNGIIDFSYGSNDMYLNLRFEQNVTFDYDGMSYSTDRENGYNDTFIRQF